MRLAGSSFCDAVRVGLHRVVRTAENELLVFL